MSMHPPWPVTSMPDWLASIGLGHLTPLMLDNGIAEDVLTSLTEADLEKLGMSMGDRKRLMRAIAELATSEPPNARPVAEPLVPNTELRQLTIMFCDLVDATALCARLSPEQWRQVGHMCSYTYHLFRSVRCYAQQGIPCKHIANGQPEGELHIKVP